MASTENAKTIDPVYFLNSQLPRTEGTLYNELDVCLAAADILDAVNVRGAQKIRNLWRIYVNTENAWIKLLTCGLMNETP